VTTPIKRALLPALTAALIAAAPAQAGWMTGNGNPPVYTTDAPCRNGMQWTYATFIHGSWPPLVNQVDLHFHAVVISPIGSAPKDPPDPALTVSFNNTLTVPRVFPALTLPPTFNLIGASLYPTDWTGRHRVNQFDFTRTFTFNFNRTLWPGTPLKLQWHDRNNQLIFASPRYIVENCWVGLITSRSEIMVRDAPVALAERMTSPFGTPRRVYQEDGNLLLEFDEKAVRAEPGTPVVIHEEPVK
jgi:hypothetical protein